MRECTPSQPTRRVELGESLAEFDRNALSLRSLAQDPAECTPRDEDGRRAETLLVPRAVDASDLDAGLVVKGEALGDVPQAADFLVHAQLAQDVHAVRRHVEEGALVVAWRGGGLEDAGLVTRPTEEEREGGAGDSTADDGDFTCVHSDSTQRRSVLRPSTSTSSVPSGGICSR